MDKTDSDRDDNSKIMPEMKEIPGLPGYFATKSGLIFSSPTRGRFAGQLIQMVTRPNNDGYISFRPTVNCKRINKRVHRVMAEAFLQRPHGSTIVRHLNDQRTDNRIENLAWGTPKDNGEDMARNGKSLKGRPIKRSHHGEKNPNQKLSESEILEIRSTWLETKPTFASLGRKYGVTYVTIRRIIFRELWRQV